MENPEQGVRHTFLLIHGTWSNNAKWILSDSSIARALISRFGPTTNIVPIHWSGKNRFSARFEAAELIKAKILRVMRNDPNRCIFLVSHSHGGSAVIYALKEDSSLRQKVAGTVFLGTPFMAFDLRPGYESITLGAAMSIVFGIVIGCLIFTGYFLEQIKSLIPYAEWLLIIIGGLVVTACLPIANRLFHKGSTLWRKLERLRYEATIRNTTASPPMNSIFIRTTGDEVALVLSTLQLLSTITNRFLELFAWLISCFTHLVSKLAHHHWGQVILVAAVSMITLAFLLVGSLAREFGTGLGSWIDILNPVANTWGFDFSESSWPEIAYEITYRIFTPIAVGIVILAAVFLITAIAAMAISTVTYSAFGQISLLRGLIFECAIEPVPIGSHNFTHVPWSRGTESRAKSSATLRHSEPYMSTQTIGVICDWAQKHSQQKPQE